MHLVNRGGGEILGRPAHRSLAALPEPPELVVIAVPQAGLDDAVDDALAAGARALVAITAPAAGDPEGAAREAALAARVREAGAVLVGTICVDVFDAAQELELVSNRLPAGAIGLLSQSGNLALEVGRLAAAVGLGFSRFVSLGNQADLDVAALLPALAEDPATRLVAVYVEDFRDGRELARAAHAAVAAGTPVVLLALGDSEATARAARSHTGALASHDDAIDAACRAAGIERVRTPRELVDLAQALLGAPPMAGRRLAVLADGGGHGGVATACAQAAGLAVPALTPALAGALAERLPATACCDNPVDLAGAGEQDLHNYAHVTEAVLAGGDFDALLLTGYFGGYGEYGPDLDQDEVAVAERLAAAVRPAGRPLVVHTMFPEGRTAAALRAGGVPVYGSVEQATWALGRLAARARATPPGVPALPAPAPPTTAGDYAEARALLAQTGIPFVAARTVHDPEAAAAAAAELGFPVAVKALGLLHKTDAGAVALDLADAGAVRAAVADMGERLTPPGFSVERMAVAPDAVELLVGARWHPRFGACVVAGLGGVHAELLDDVAVALAPVDVAGARALLGSLRAARLLGGARGRPGVDVAAVAEAIAALSRLAAAHPELAELEINPLLCAPAGVVALDARVVPAARADRGGPPWSTPTPPSSAS